MSDLSDQNTRAAANLAHDRINDLIDHFQGGGSWDDFGPGRTVPWLEQTKMDLVMLASCLESRIQEVATVVQDFGT